MQYLKCKSACSTSYYSGIDIYDSDLERCEVSCSLFTDKPYHQGQSCQKACPIYHDSSLGCLDECTGSVPYIESGKLCISHCQSDAYEEQIQGRVCVDNCQFFLLNASDSDSHWCQKRCPMQLQFVDDGLCVEECDSSYYWMNTTTNINYCLAGCGSQNVSALEDFPTQTRCETNCTVFRAKII